MRPYSERPLLPKHSPKRIAVKKARILRQNQTDAEEHLWYFLRAHRFLGLKFKRQKPVGPYVVDFVCLEYGLVIEVDGGQHAQQISRDSRRSAFLAERGLKVLRFWNNDVVSNTDAVLEAIRLELAAQPSPLTPLPLTGEGNQS